MISSFMGFANVWLTALEIAVSLIVITIFFWQLLRGRISMRWMRDRLGWWW